MRAGFVRGAKRDAQVIDELRGRSPPRAFRRVRGNRADGREQLPAEPRHAGDVEGLEAFVYDTAEFTRRIVHTEVEVVWHRRTISPPCQPNVTERTPPSAFERRSQCRPYFLAPVTLTPLILSAVHS